MTQGPLGGPRPAAKGELWLALELNAERIELEDLVDVWTAVGANLDVNDSSVRAEILNNLGPKGGDECFFTVKLTQNAVFTHQGGYNKNQHSPYMAMIRDVDKNFKGDMISSSVGLQRFDISPETPDEVYGPAEIADAGEGRLSQFIDRWSIRGK